MGVTNGPCGVDEYHDVVSGLCSHCSDICRDKTTSKDSCQYHCLDYFNRLLLTTLEIPVVRNTTSVLFISVLVLSGVIVFISILAVTFLCLWRSQRFRIQKRSSDFRDSTSANCHNMRRHRRYRARCQISIQETRDPNKEEEQELSILYVSPCSSIITSQQVESKFLNETASMKSSSRVPPFQLPYFNIELQRHNIVAGEGVSLKNKEFWIDSEETLPKVLYDDENASVLLCHRADESANSEHHSGNEACKQVEVELRADDNGEIEQPIIRIQAPYFRHDDDDSDLSWQDHEKHKIRFLNS